MVLRVKQSSGFSLFELLIVMAAIGAIAAMILPSINISFGSKVSHSARELAMMMKASLNEAVISGKVHRIVFDLKEGSYWAEKLGSETAMRFEVNPEDLSLFEKDAQKRLFDAIKEKKTQLKSMTSITETEVPNSLDLIIEQGSVFEKRDWVSLDGTLLSKKVLDTSLMFLKVKTDLMLDPKEFFSSTAPGKEQAYLYFFPEGFTSSAYIQISSLLKNQSEISKASGVTLVLNALSGRSVILRGLQDVTL